MILESQEKSYLSSDEDEPEEIDSSGENEPESHDGDFKQEKIESSDEDEPESSDEMLSKRKLNGNLCLYSSPFAFTSAPEALLNSCLRKFTSS